MRNAQFLAGPGNPCVRFFALIGSRVLLCALGSKIQVCEGGNVSLAADLDVQVAQVFDSWMNEKSARAQSSFFFCWG